MESFRLSVQYGLYTAQSILFTYLLIYLLRDRRPGATGADADVDRVGTVAKRVERRPGKSRDQRRSVDDERRVSSDH